MIKNAQDIKDNAPIEEIIGQYVELRREGKNYKACCPFHQEKTPSFHVNVKEGYYKCFGCGVGGDTVNFLMEHSGMTYPEALEHIAKFRNMTVEYEQQGKRPEIIQQEKARKEKRQAQLDQLKWVAEAFFRNVFEAYLNAGNFDHGIIDVFGRSYSYKTLKQFGISYTEPTKFLLSLQLDPEQKKIFQEVGLLKNGKEFFYHRLLFPIFDHQSRVVGFAGRKIGDRKGPKYINSPESLAYKKDQVLYGIHVAKRSIRDLDQAILSEGYTDVLTMYDYGIHNSLASGGTAFTDKQAQLLKRFTHNVLILRDGDEAGFKAAKRDVETCVRNGLYPKVCILAEGEDPDSFLRKHNRRLFDTIIETKTKDGILWRVMQEWDEKDNFKKEAAYDLAGELLCYLSGSLQESYLRDLTHKKRMGSVKTQLKDAIKRHAEKQLKKVDLNKQQVNDIVNFGIYEKSNRYFVSNNQENGNGFSVSNFVIHPIMLIIGATYSQRLIEIVNVYGKSFILNLESQVMTSLSDFRKAVESKGNYILTNKPEFYHKIKTKVYSNFTDCFPIGTMGQHAEGFYVWGNGISLDGAFKHVDEYGVVEHQKTKYFLPAFSRIQNNIKSDDVQEQFEFEKKWVYYPTPVSIGFKEWTFRMLEVHGWNGAMGVAFYLASLFKDIIFSKFNYFPHLNHFGPSGSGKSFAAQSIMAMFGKSDKHDPFNLSTGTRVAFHRRLAQVSNGIVWFDEYSNNIDHRRVELIKGAYDGAGHQKGVASSDNRTTTTKVKSALIITGQEQATKDIAMFKRMISLNFKSGKNSLDKQIKARELKAIEKTGQLTQITQKLLTHRGLIEEHFSEKFNNIRVIYNKYLEEEGYSVEDRVVNNHVIPMAIAALIAKKETMGFAIDDLYKYTLSNIVTQSNSIQSEDEVSIWWRIFEYLVAAAKLHEYSDFVVEEKSEELFQDELKRGKEKESEMQRFEEPKKLLYITFAKSHPEYQERHQRQRGKNGLDLGALQYYLKATDAYLGKKRAKRIGKSIKVCFVFEVELLPIDMPISEKK